MPENVVPKVRVELTQGHPLPVFECGAMPSMKWCHVLRRAHLEAKTIPNLVPRVAICWNVWPHLRQLIRPTVEPF